MKPAPHGGQVSLQERDGNRRFVASTQTTNAPEDVDSRQQRIKLETAIIEQHNESLEKKHKKALNKPAAHMVEESEVCDVVMLSITLFPGCLYRSRYVKIYSWLTQHCLLVDKDSY